MIRGFVLKPTERAYVLLKNSTGYFRNSPLFERSAGFYVTISGNFFNALTNFLENENLFKKLECRFLVESIKMEKPISSYKTAIPEANFKTNRIVSTK